MTSATRGRNILATELLKDGYHERAERVAAGNEFMSDEPAVRACVEAVGEALPAPDANESYAAWQQRRGMALDTIDWAINECDGFMLDDDYDAQGCLNRISAKLRLRRAFLNAEAAAALALPSPVRQGEDEEEGDPGVMNLRAPEVDKLLADLDQAIEEGAGHLALESVRIVRLMRAEHRRLAALSPVRESVLEEAAKVADDKFADPAWGPHYRNAAQAIAHSIRALKSDIDFTGHIDCPEDEGGRG